MKLQELFANAENGMLTYDQLKELTEQNNVKLVDLSEGNYVSKQKYTDELAARDTRITSLDEIVASRDADLQALKAQLETAGTDASKLSELTTQFEALQAKYDNDTKELQAKMSEQAYKHAVMDFANTQKFTSQAAKRDFVNSLLDKHLQMENDMILGATDFVSAYQKDNADAFVVEQPKEPAEPKPQFVGPTGDGPSQSGDNGSEFNFNFAGIRPH